jgi:ADP-ribose pyrophosphatase YjhB (NUDIX family)
MKKLLLLVIAVMFSFGHTLAEPPAGMVLYFQSGGEVYLLLAEHANSQRGWAAFGGGARTGETVAETAAHKAEEESRGAYKRTDLLKLIQNQKPVMDGDFASYFAEVPFIPAQRVMNNSIPEDDDAYGERSTFAWIPYSAIVPHLAAKLDREIKYPIDPAYLPAGSDTQWFWRAWLSNMQKAAKANALPW